MFPVCLSFFPRTSPIVFLLQSQRTTHPSQLRDTSSSMTSAGLLPLPRTPALSSPLHPPGCFLSAQPAMGHAFCLEDPVLPFHTPHLSLSPTGLHPSPLLILTVHAIHPESPSRKQSVMEHLELTACCSESADTSRGSVGIPGSAQPQLGLFCY